MARNNDSNANPKDKAGKSSSKTEKTLTKKKSNTSPADDNESSEEELDEMEYRKFLNKMFPSKHMKNKVDAGKKLKKALEIDIEDSADDSDDDYEEDDEDSEPVKVSKKNKILSKNPPVKKHKKTKVEEDDDDDEVEVEEDGGNEPKRKSKKNKKSPRASAGGGSGNYNIIFTVGGEEYDEDDSEWGEEHDEDSDEYDDSESENEDESVSTVTDSSADEEDIDDEDSDEEEEEEYEPRKYRRNKTRNVMTRSMSKQLDEEDDEENEEKTEKKTSENSTDSKSNNENAADILSVMKRLCSENPKNKLLQESMNMGIEHYKSKIEKSSRHTERKEQKQKDKNARIFKKLLRNKDKTNDYTFFDGMEKEKQIKIIKEIREVNKIHNIETPYRINLLQSEIPHVFKSIALKKLNSLKYMEPGSGEFYKIKNWVDTFMRIPFNTIRTLPVNINDGVDKCHDFMENAQKTLDNAVFGLDDAKMQIMQMLGQLVTNPQAIGSAIAIKGPMGTGKTTLVKEGISKILDRPFAFLALGGATDSSFLEGHSYTYEGSVWGKIVQILLDSKCMNPVIYFDELDKISDTPKGEEIAGILTHLTDTSQNTQFHDKYFSEVDFDLSKCLFIFSYNDESKVNPILRDRMYRIQTKGYDVKEKLVISNNHLVPKIREQVMFKEDDIIIPDETIRHIVETHCDKEDGVRNLKRCIEIIYTKLNLYRLMKPGTNLFKKEMELDVSFPLTVSKEIVDKLIKRENKSWTAQTMYI